MSFVKTPWIAALLAVALLQAAPAKAETFNTCAGFIDSVPATITTQGVWCLRKDLATAMSSGNAITIATNNVTIDCNGFKIGGLSAGSSSSAIGIQSEKQNSTVRHCAIRGFLYGIKLAGSGNLVEDNRLDQNLFIGIAVYGENNLVQRNAVYDTGGSPGEINSHGISAAADVIDNTVAGVFGMATDSGAWGISAAGVGSEVRGNRVRGLVVTGAGSAKGIKGNQQAMTITGNRVSAQGTTAGIGIDAGDDTFCTGNTVVNFATAYDSCAASDGNLTLPVAP